MGTVNINTLSKKDLREIVIEQNNKMKQLIKNTPKASQMQLKVKHTSKGKFLICTIKTNFKSTLNFETVHEYFRTKNPSEIIKATEENYKFDVDNYEIELYQYFTKNEYWYLEFHCQNK